MSKKGRLKNLNKDIKIKEAEMRLKMIGMVESMPSFAKDKDEKFWTVIGQGKEEYTQNEMTTIRENAQKIYYTSPLARGIIETLVNFVIGVNFKIVPEAEDEKIKEYWDNFCIKNKMDMRIKELVKRTFRDGEIFLRYFNDKGDEPPFVRFLRPSQISDKSNKYTFGIETDPNDVEIPIRYHREYADSNGQQNEEIIEAKYIMHTKILVDSDVKRGISFLIGIIKYIKDYTDFLNDRKHLNKIRTIFNLIGKPTGVTSAGTFADGFTNSTVKSTSGGSQTYNKKLPKSGSVLMTKGVEYDFKNVDLHAGDTKHDGRSMLLMIVAGSNLAEYMVTGDASNANYASTMVSESPAVRAFEAWQDFFSHPFKEIYKKVIMDAVKNGVLPEKYEKITQKYDIEKKKIIERKEIVMVTGKCTLEFPPLIHRDIDKETKAFSIQDEMGYASKKTISTKLGYEYEEIEKPQIIQEKQEEEQFDMGDEHKGDDDE